MRRCSVIFWLAIVLAPSISSSARAAEQATFGSEYRRGGVLFKAGDLAGAELALTAALRLDAGRAEGWNALALVAYARRDSDRAVECLGRAIKLQPGYREAWLNRGLARFSVGEYAEAVSDLTKVLSFPVRDELVTDFDLAVAMYRAKVKAGEMTVTFEAALAQGLLAVDREAAYANRFRRLAKVLAAGPGFRPAFVDRSVHYEVSTNDSQPFAQIMAFHLEIALTEYQRLFPPPQDLAKGRRFRAKIFRDRRMYVRYLTDIIRDRATAELSGGSYHPVTRELLLTKNASLDGTLLVLFHEGLHQYFDSFMAAPPIWFSEGVADYFGAARVVGNRMIPGAIHPTRVDALRKAVNGTTPPDLARLLHATPRQFMNAGQTNIHLRQQVIARNYALSWALVHYLVHEDKSGTLRSYFDALVAGKTAALAYAGAFGDRNLAELSRTLVAYARKNLLP